MNNKKHVVTIKGTKEGLTFFIDENSSFDQVLHELDQKLSSTVVDKEKPMITVNVSVGNRYLTSEQQEQIKTVIRSKQKFIVSSIESNVITRDEAKEWQKDSQINSIYRMVRSGQVIEVRGDLLLIGDVNPGGKVTATGNIYVLGELKGIAHAGVNGNEEAVIAASYMKPNQLRIANYISRSPDYETEGVYMECAYVKTEKIVIDELQVLAKTSPYFSSVERRMSNG
ncbi:septum site-determining protein MinC [Salirhabdus salicampi]|uniref:septum site-determining protein MinC n=1 Tax=Salirhabdus salicampi TaxID=476102 RepID=UPI0020C4BFEF|nr:septum site-determining protein MinC [Salirhabdus salicampi]